MELHLNPTRRNSNVRIVSVGEVLWDVFDDSEFLGGAPLNFSANLHRLGHSVMLFTAVGNDRRGETAREQMRALGLTTELVQTAIGRPTGIAQVKTDASGSATFVIERPAAFDSTHYGEGVASRLRAFRPEWIYFGTLAQTDSGSEESLLRLLRECEGAGRFYDLNLRTGHWNFPLLERLSRAATVLKLNDVEAELLFCLCFDATTFSLEEFCRNWSSRYGVQTICITLGREGCAVFTEGTLHRFPGFPIEVADTVGAGDAFAAGFLHGLHKAWPMARIACFANALGAVVAARPGATPHWTLEDVELTACTR
jgi:fructokinase